MSVFAFSDIHGQRKLFDQIMAEIGSNDTIYFLGDAIDRGPDGWNILKELLNDPRVFFIKGNHEDMMVKALYDFPNYHPWSRAMEVWEWNGCYSTLEGIEADNNEEEIKNILYKVASLPLFINYTNPFGDVFWLSHAGCNYSENGPDITDASDFVWNRNHFFPNETDDEIPDNLYIVHGHTPIIHLVEQLAWFDSDAYNPSEIQPGAFYYANGHKIDIDCGAHFTNTTVLLNLDTFEEKVFTM